MLKRWFELNGNGATRTEPHRNGAADQAAIVEEVVSAVPPEPPAAADEPDEFELIYRNATVKPPQLPYGIMRVIGMLNSPHVAALTPEARRPALMMALEAVGAEVEDLLQDAVVRQRALKEYEERQQEKLRRVEAEKLEENRKLQAEMERVTADYMARMQANLDFVARQQDELRAWQRRKNQQSQQIADAAAMCVPEATVRDSGLAAVLERACVARR
ncbi:MAG TPA: hypothetical protein VKX45_08345 [Bryobacteraceae bacterium]|jgi:hypothetical protein|nr:hypothetical protein [Bryobacteraceae bacterium]